MKNRWLHWTRGALLGLTVALAAGLSAAPPAQAQQPCINSGTAPSAVQAILSLQAQGADVTCDSHNMYVWFPDGTFFDMIVPDNGAMTLYTFNPHSGQSTYFYIQDGTLWIQDNVHGLINGTDGWFGIFYLVGNPFDASIENPMQVLFQDNLPPGFQDPASDWRSGKQPPYQPGRPVLLPPP